MYICIYVLSLSLCIYIYIHRCIYIHTHIHARTQVYTHIILIRCKYYGPILIDDPRPHDRGSSWAGDWEFAAAGCIWGWPAAAAADSGSVARALGAAALSWGSLSFHEKSWQYVTITDGNGVGGNWEFCRDWVTGTGWNITFLEIRSIIEPWLPRHVGRARIGSTKAKVDPRAISIAIAGSNSLQWC